MLWPFTISHLPVENLLETRPLEEPSLSPLFPTQLLENTPDRPSCRATSARPVFENSYPRIPVVPHLSVLKVTRNRHDSYRARWQEEQIMTSLTRPGLERFSLGVELRLYH